MKFAIIQVPLYPREINQLTKEFPNYVFLTFPRMSTQSISKEHWQRAEVFFGEKLTEENLAEAHQLRWVHTPSFQVHRLCVKEIERKGNILISNTREEHVFQIGEFVLAGILAFAKNLFHFKEADHFPALVWDTKWRNHMWTLKDKTLLQIGTGRTGLEITRRAEFSGMKIWCMDEKNTFHPHCNKSFCLNELRSVLPAVDILSITIGREQVTTFKLREEDLALMKEDSILCILGPAAIFDEEALVKYAPKFRGILFDCNFQTPLSLQSKLWDLPNVLITPEVAPRPKGQEGAAFKTFRFNLRQFIHGNFQDMRNLLDPTLIASAEGWV